MPRNSRYAGPIENVIVLMLENRSYDNVLGWLYRPENPPPFNRAPPGQASLNGLGPGCVNPDPAGGPPIPVWNSTAADATTIPVPHPGETFADVAQQVYGLAQKPGKGDNPTQVGRLGSMGGFAANFVEVGGIAREAMHSFIPAQVPVTSWLANRFSVSDCWYASCPSQTFPNRFFTHCGAPGSRVSRGKPTVSLLDNAEYISPLLRGGINLPSVFSQLDAVYPKPEVPNWKVYFHDYAAAIFVKYVRAIARGKTNVNLAPFDASDWGAKGPWLLRNFKTSNHGRSPTTFQEDLDHGTLAKYTFIEPRYCDDFPLAVQGLNPNSNHPGGTNIASESAPGDRLMNVTHGEIFLGKVFNALYQSKYWRKSLLIVTYDEPGGTYDHVVPPAAPMPGKTTTPPARNGYAFNTLGPRVPALLVSPWIPPGTTFRPSGDAAIPGFDHTAIIKTVWECFHLTTRERPSLTLRDAAMEGLLRFASLDSPGNNPGPVALPAPPAPIVVPKSSKRGKGVEGAWPSYVEALLKLNRVRAPSKTLRPKRARR